MTMVHFSNGDNPTLLALIKPQSEICMGHGCQGPQIHRGIGSFLLKVEHQFTQDCQKNSY